MSYSIAMCTFGCGGSFRVMFAVTVDHYKNVSDGLDVSSSFGGRDHFGEYFGCLALIAVHLC